MIATATINGVTNESELISVRRSSYRSHDVVHVYRVAADVVSRAGCLGARSAQIAKKRVTDIYICAGGEKDMPLHSTRPNGMFRPDDDVPRKIAYMGKKVQISIPVTCSQVIVGQRLS
jgi:hypothetical protein